MIAKLARWNDSLVAERLRALVEERGSPNRFRIQEITQAIRLNPVDVLVVSRVLVRKIGDINAHLAPAGIRASYEPSCGKEPARITIKNLQHSRRPEGA